MTDPGIECRISARCRIHPSEDPDKIRRAVSNVLPGSDVRIRAGAAGASARGPDTLGRILEAARTRRTHRAYVRHMTKNLEGGSTWFYLNKQAAFAGRMALCDGADESPLGPIKIIVESGRIDRLIDRLRETESKNPSQTDQKF